MNRNSKFIIILIFGCGFLFLEKIYAQNIRVVSLVESLQSALKNNLSLQSEWMNVQISEADIINSKIRPNPILNNQSLQLLRTSLYPAQSEWFDNRNRQVWWQFTKPMQWPGQRALKMENANQRKQIVQSSFEESQRNLLNDVANKWVDTWYARKSMDLILQARSNIDTLVSINNYRLKNQVINQSEYLRTKLVADQYRMEMNRVSTEYRLRLKELALLINDSGIFDIDTTAEFLSIELKSNDQFFQDAIQNRSDLKQIFASEKWSKSNISLQRKLAFPQPELGVIWNPQNSIPYLGTYGTVKIPFFDRNQGEIYRAEITQKQLLVNEKFLTQKIKTEINTAYESLVLFQNNIKQYNEIIAQSESILNSIKFSYLRGGTNIIDFLEAQRTWLETRRQYYAAVQQYRLARIRMYFVSGTFNTLLK